VAFIVNNTIKISCKSSGQYDKYKNSGRIWGSYGGQYEDGCLLGWIVVFTN
jgi:hypothetical protein